MPTQIPLSALLSAIQPSVQGTGENSPYILINGQLQSNPAYLNPLNAQQLSTTVNGPTPGAIAGGAYATAANEGARLAASAIGQQAVPYTSSELQNLIDPTTNQELPVGTTPGQVKGKTFINKDQQTQVQELNGVQNFIGLVRKASDAVNIHSGIAGTNRSPAQFLESLKLKATGDANAQLLDQGAKGLLSQVLSTVGVNRFNPDEINALAENLPNSGDTRELAKAKLDRLQGIVDAKKKALVEGTSSSSTDFADEQSALSSGLPSGTAITVGGRQALIQ
jgi:hypothetical protein